MFEVALRVFCAFALCLIVGPFFRPAVAEEGPCNLTYARAVAKTYVLANPLLAQRYERTRQIKDPHPYLVGFVKDYPQLFAQSSRHTRCARVLGQILIQLGVNAYNPNAFNDVMGRFGGTQVAELTPRVIQSINEDAVKMVTLGQELLWLSQVLPEAAQGNWKPYVSTGTIFRQRIRQEMVMVNRMALFDPAFADILIRVAAAAGNQFVSQQIVVLALTYADGIE